MILYTKDKSTYFDIQNHLKEVSPTFYPPLSERVNIDDYAQKIRKFGVTFEAWIDNCLIGLVACYVNDVDKEQVYITHVSVSKFLRGIGVAHTLFSMLLLDEQVRGFKYVQLEVWKHNNAAVLLYNSLGFNLVTQKSELLVMRLYL